MYLLAFLVQDDLDSPSITASVASSIIFLSKNCALKLQDWVKGLVQIVKGRAEHFGSYVLLILVCIQVARTSYVVGLRKYRNK